MHAQYDRGFQGQHTVLTLGDAVAAVSAVTKDEREVVAVVMHMLRRQSIRLVGTRSTGDRSRLHGAGAEAGL